MCRPKETVQKSGECKSLIESISLDIPNVVEAIHKFLSDISIGYISNQKICPYESHKQYTRYSEY